jgi:hypothetical protein
MPLKLSIGRGRPLAAERQGVRRTVAGFGKVPRMFAGGNMFATAAGDLSARGAPLAAMRARGWRCGKVNEPVVARSVAKLGDRGTALADESQWSLPLPSNKPLQRSPPQGHRSIIESPARRPHAA